MISTNVDIYTAYKAVLTTRSACVTDLIPLQHPFREGCLDDASQFRFPTVLYLVLPQVRLESLCCGGR